MRRRLDGALGVVYAAAMALAAAAVFGLVRVFESGSDGQAVSAKLIFTAAGLSVFLLVGSAGVMLAMRRRGLAWFGVLTVLVALVAFVLSTRRIWVGEPAYVFYGLDSEASVIATLTALGCGPIALLLSWQRNAGVGAQLAYVASAALASMALLATVLILFDDADIDVRVFGVLAIVYLLTLELVPLAALSAWGKNADQAGSAALELDHAVIAVSDREAATRFYTTLLGAEVVSMPGDRIAFRLGDRQLNVHEPGVAAQPLAGDPVRPGNSDLCFVWPALAESAVTLMAEMGVEPVEGPVDRVGARGPGRSVYCRDPDGSLIELISYSG